MLGTPPRDRRLTAVATVVVLGAILSILDTTVVNVAIETLGRELDAPLATIQWISTGYMLALATVIPVTGWAADRYGARRLFLVASALFAAASALAGAAWSAESLIAFRVLQGLGGGMILPAGMTLIAQTAGPQRVARTMSAVGIPLLLAPVAGPLLGGWLVEAVSWRWIFLVNVPAGALVVAVGARLLPHDPPPQPSQPLDGRGLALLSPGLVALVYGLAQVEDGAVALVPIALGIALVAAFAVHALRVRDPLLDLRLLRTREVAASALTLLLLGAAFLGTLFLLPLYLQLVRGESALQTGVLLIPQGVGAAAAMSVAGRLADRAGASRVVLAGLVPFALALAALTRLGADTSYAALSAVLLLFGLGMGATMMPAMAAAYRPLARAQAARATALLTVVQRAGSSLGVALVALALSGAGDGADAFADAFRWPLALVLCAFPPAALLSRGGRDRGR